MIDVLFSIIQIVALFGSIFFTFQQSFLLAFICIVTTFILIKPTKFKKWDDIIYFLMFSI